MEQVLFNSVYLGMQYALIALGLTLVFSLMKVLNFAHGQMYVLGGFVVYQIYAVYEIPYLIALLCAMLTLFAVGAIFEICLFRPVLRRSKREESSMLLAAGTALLLESVVLLVFREKQRGVPKILDEVSVIGDMYIPHSRLLVIALSGSLIIGFILFMQYTRPGRAMRALAQDREAAQLQGVNVDRYSMLGLAAGAMLAGAAGAILAPISGVNSGLGTAISIKAFIMVMIGGAGVISGAIAGGLILGVLESFGLNYLPDFFEAIGYEYATGSETYLIIFIALIIFLSIRPHGLMGKPWG